MYPHDIDVVQQLEGVSPEQEAALNEDTLERVQTAAAEAGRKVELLQWSTLLDTVGWYTGNTFTLTAQEGVSTEIQILTADDYGRLTGRTVALGPGQVLVQAENIDLPATFYIEDLPFHVARDHHRFPPLQQLHPDLRQAAQLSLVVADETVVSAINVRDTSDHREFHVPDGPGRHGDREAGLCGPSAGGGCERRLLRHQAARTTPWTCTPCTAAFCSWVSFLGLLFLLSTVLIIYYKQISRGIRGPAPVPDHAAGGHEPPGGPLLHPQPGAAGVLPAPGDGGHPCGGGLPLLCKLLELFNLFDVGLFALCTAGTLLVFCAIYALVYGLTTRTYSRIVGIRS